MHCRQLSSDDFSELFQTFKSSFSNNAVKLQPTEEEFAHRIFTKLDMDNEISAAAYDGDEMRGFILHTSNIYQGIPTAYNGGTGVLPGFRNQKVAEQLYEFLIPKIRAKFLARILLEVVDVNEYAIKLYEKIGFVFKRHLRCYQQVDPIKGNAPKDVYTGNISEINFLIKDFDTSFLDSEPHINTSGETVLVARENHKVIGYLIFQPSIGRISQMAVENNYRNQLIGTSLLCEAQRLARKKLTIMNIPEDEKGFDSFLKKCGFENQVNQFEMELII